MKTFTIKFYWVLILLSQICLFLALVLSRRHFEWINNEQPFYISVLILCGLALTISSPFFLIQMIGLAKTNDEIDNKNNETLRIQEETKKLLEFIKIKALHSAVVTKEQINEHMGWELNSKNNEK